MEEKTYSKFEAEVTIRPDDIDVNNHVHLSKYMDYVLAGRYIQMEKDYKMSMQEFWDKKLTWVATTAHLEYKREIKLDDKFVIVQNRVRSFSGAQSIVDFWILKGSNKKIAAEGYFSFTLLSTETGRPSRITPDIIEKYTI